MSGNNCCGRHPRRRIGTLLIGIIGLSKLLSIAASSWTGMADLGTCCAAITRVSGREGCALCASSSRPPLRERLLIGGGDAPQGRNSHSLPTVHQPHRWGTIALTVRLITTRNLCCKCPVLIMMNTFYLSHAQVSRGRRLSVLSPVSCGDSKFRGGDAAKIWSVARLVPRL